MCKTVNLNIIFTVKIMNDVEKLLLDYKYSLAQKDGIYMKCHVCVSNQMTLMISSLQNPHKGKIKKQLWTDYLQVRRMSKTMG